VLSPSAIHSRSTEDTPEAMLVQTPINPNNGPLIAWESISADEASGFLQLLLCRSKVTSDFYANRTRLFDSQTNLPWNYSNVADNVTEVSRLIKQVLCENREIPWRCAQPRAKVHEAIG